VTEPNSAQTGSTEERLDAGAVKERASRGVVTLGMRGLATRFLGLAGNIFLARMLFPSEFGALAFGFTIVTFASVLSSGGLGAALVRRKETPTRRDLESVFGFQLLAMSSAAALIIVIGAFSGRAGALAAVMALSLPIDAVRVPSALMTERTLAFNIIARAEVGEIAVYNVAAIAAVAAGLGVWGVAGATILRAIAGSAILVHQGSVGLIRPRISRTFLRATARFGLTFQSVGIVGLVRDQGFNLIVAAVGGLSVLGYWTVASRLLQALVLLFESLWRVAFPAMARLVEIESDPGPILERGLRVAAVATGAIVVVLAGTAPALVPTLFGERWHDSIAILPWAGLGALILGPLAACATGYLSAIKQVGTVLRGAGLQAAVLFATGVPLLDRFGTIGLGISWLAGSIANAVVLGRAVRRHAGINVIATMASPVAAACIAAVPAYALATVVDPAAVALAVSAAVAAGTYLALSSLLCRAELLYIARLGRRVLVPSRRMPQEVAA
jgi:O-antigen/teichoic acid export membrane protein